MTEPTIHVVDDVAQAGAEYVVAGLRAALDATDTASLVLAGGNTPLALYALLAEVSDLPWERVHAFWGDERLVPPDDPGSNHAASPASAVVMVTPMTVRPGGSTSRSHGKRSDLVCSSTPMPLSARTRRAPRVRRHSRSSACRTWG